MESMPTKIKVENFNAFYGDFQALRDISVDIPIHRITSIIGPSGCGKSTFLRSFNRMNDLIPNTRAEGNIFLDSQNLCEVDVVALRKRVGMVFQRPNPFSNQSLTTWRMAHAPTDCETGSNWPRSWNAVCAMPCCGTRSRTI